MPCGRPTLRETTVNGRTISYELHRNPQRRKHLTISVEGERLRVLSPMKTPQRQIDAFIQQRADWIESRLVMDPPTGLQAELRDGGSLPLLGVEYPVESSLAAFDFDGRRFRVNEARPERAADEEGWLREYARDYFIERIKHWSPMIGATPQRLQIRNQKTRWGSASSSGTLSLNWRLIFARPEIIDYVIVHELCHFVRPDHSPEYWRLVEKHVPDYREHRRWLKDSADRLSW